VFVIAAADRYTGFHGGSLGLLVAAATALVVFGVVFAIRFVASFPKQPDPGPETSDLGPEPPALVNMLVNRFEVRRAAIAATLVDLAARRVIGLEEVGPDRFVVRVKDRAAAGARDPDPAVELLPYEQQVLDAVREDATGGSAPVEAIDLGSTEAAAAWWTRFSRAVVADARARGLARNRWERSDWILLGGLAGVVLFFFFAAMAGAHVGSGGTKPMDGSDWFFISLFSWGFVMVWLLTLRAVRDTPEGRAAAARWLGVRTHQQTNPQFADATPASVAIWGRNLSYGIALGTARAAAAALPLGAEDPSVAWSRAGGSWRQVRIEYPTRFGYGQKPSGVLAGGVGRLALWGVISFVVLPGVGQALWRFIHDQVPNVGSTAELAIAAAFVVVFGAMGGYLVIRLVDGAVRTGRAAADLGAPVTIEGTVIKVGSGEQARYVAVDDGSGPETRAWKRPTGSPELVRGARVRVTLTPHLGYVTGVEVLAPPARPGPPDVSSS